MHGSKPITNLEVLKERTNPIERIHTYIYIFIIVHMGSVPNMLNSCPMQFCAVKYNLIYSSVKMRIRFCLTQALQKVRVQFHIE